MCLYAVHRSWRREVTSCSVVQRMLAVGETVVLMPSGVL